MMQGVLALCHFCETHGPRVVMTHQPMKDDFANGSSDKNGMDQFISAAATSMEPSTSTAPQGPILPISQFDTNGAYVARSPTSSLHYGLIDSIDHIAQEERCDSCYSFKDGPFLLSNDHQNQVSYISSETALQNTAYERIRVACIKSLSNEVAKLPVEKNGSVTSPKSTQDPPLIPHPIFPPIRCVMTRESSISGSTQSPSPRSPSSPSCVSSISDIDINGFLPSNGSEEEKDGRLVFGDAENGYTFSYSFRLYDCRARGSLRLYSLIINSTDRQVITKNLEFLHSSFEYIKLKLQRMSKETFERDLRCKPPVEKSFQPKYKWIANAKATEKFINRSLKSITGHDGIWQLLHRYMMWTLRSPAITCRDQVMEGKPTQDMMVLMELDESAIIELELHHPNQHWVSMHQLANLKTIAQQLDVCNEPGDLDLLFRHVATGGQVVIESRDKSLCRQALLALCNLLPIGCLKLATYKEHYRPEDSRRYNLIGGPVNMDIPLEVSMVLVLRITARDFSDENVSLQDCQIEIRRRPENNGVCGANPQIVKRFKELLLDPDVNGTILESALRATRDTWLSKARICYQMRIKLKSNGITSTMEDYALRGTSAEDRQVLHFWQGGLSNAYKNHVISNLDPVYQYDIFQH